LISLRKQSISEQPTASRDASRVPLPDCRYDFPAFRESFLGRTMASGVAVKADGTRVSSQNDF
jgi:hypothetical protein